jgi:nucleotide-binding universal stress UspA family protein
MTMQPRPQDAAHPRVVVGYDGSARSRAAVERAVEAAGDDGPVFVVHAYAQPHSWLGRPNYQERLDAALDDAKATIRELRDDSGGPLARVAWVPEIIGGDPAQAIADVAAARHVDEIVVGSRKLGLTRVHGGVAEALLRTTDVPVTVMSRAA